MSKNKRKKVLKREINEMKNEKKVMLDYFLEESIIYFPNLNLRATII